MHYSTALAVLAGFGSLASAAPAHEIHAVAARTNNNNGNKKNSKNNNNGNNNGATIVGISPAAVVGSTHVVVEQTILQPQITVVQENLDLVNQLAVVAEQEFSALVQSQLALVNEVETIKNNIRVNHFAARFSQVNTVIVSVTELVDLRGGAGSRNSRYMVNQLLADNNKPGSTVVVMMTAANPVTINAAQPTLDLAGLLGANATVLPSGVVASAASAASASVATTAAAASASGASVVSNVNASSSGLAGISGLSGNIVAYDPNNPFGQIGQTVILPYGSKAPSLPNGAQIVVDPANIILPNQAGLLVENINQFSQDCALYSANSLSLFNLQSSIIAAEAVAALEASSLSLGSSSSLNAAAAALLSGAGGFAANVGSSSISTSTTTTAASTSTAAAATAAVATSSVAAAAPAAASTAAAAAVVAGAAVVSPVAPAAPATPAAAGGVGVQIVPIAAPA
ncbi:hypothetical protein SPBR_02791 [Sporothrix brasiliensis 5110]|uniref:Uncharacterized protein n=1 Tax=Sporothrix brasiliensis 5110 TaxID=1398154 RepID=A0A0C2F1Z2_9PEZI|nr:uncharacterized protein SPBR_02791 [Sporothrix brasiliensis 5110]KIH92954.1 hypothetical protein SPBR_02791 [Sporothrix brasiliensis 5110]